MGNIVKLVFQTVATGNGLSKMYGEFKGLAAAMPGLTKATMILGQTFGTTGAAVGRMATMLLQGGIWGVAAEGARLLIEKFGLFKDRTEETKEKLDKLAESTRKFYETINENSKIAFEKIDKETKLRNEQLDITNRMIKAELQLQKARAIASGDAQGVERIDRQMTEQDQKTAIQKAGFEVDSSAKRRDEAEAKMAATIAAEAKAARELSDAEAALASKSKPVETVMQSSAGAFVQTQTRDTTEEKAAVETAKKRLELAKQQTVAAKEAYGIERDKYELAVANVKVLEAEQKAAVETARSDKMAAAMKDEKERVAAEEKAIDDMAYAEADKKRKLKEKEAQDAKRKLVEQLKAEADARNKARQDSLRKDIEADRQRVAELEARLADARAAVPATIDVLGNAGKMDQAGDIRADRQKDITDERFNDRFTKLLTSGKIKKDANGNWKMDGRASNLDKAVLDRLNANEKVKRAEAEAAKERQRLEKMEGYLKTISETIKTATEI